MSTTPKANVVDFTHRRAPQGSKHHGGPRSFSFSSILFEKPTDRAEDESALQPPNFFPDLNCDQIVDAITAGRDEYALKPLFYWYLSRADAIRYRQEVIRDLEREPLYHLINLFSAEMREVRANLARVQKAHYKEQKHSWFLNAVELYCDSINSFSADLIAAHVESRGFLAFREYLSAYARSSSFNALLATMQRLKTDLATIEYCVLIRGSGFTVRKYEGEADYSREVELTFEKFKQGAVRDYRVTFEEKPEMNHIEAKITEFVANLYPEIFVPLNDFYINNQGFIDDTVARFDREVQFYVAYLEYIAPLRQLDLRFCYPLISEISKEIHSADGFDVALAHRMKKDNSRVVPNDFSLKRNERILVVSGPNQGGKTTFARTFGQLHYLASLGCPVPGREATLFLFDRIFTHFEREEKVENLRGKLEDDLLRIRHILDLATPRSLVIMNEIFTSTTVQDEIFLSKKIIEKIIERDLLCILVTFVDELASLAPQTVSMVSTVVPENPALRTFKIVRRPADGLAYAMAIAQKYRLTYDAITSRINS